jgi:acyl transferase domain-containing protein/surfactin synthase thioesterase subunit
MAATTPNGAIAIVGMAGRFPGAANIAAFWDLLRDGKEGLTFFTEQQLREAGVEERLLANPNYVRVGGALQDYDRFDAGFFGIGRAEAELLDPQQRIFLECAWEALESAGYEPRKTQGRIGVFAGANLSSYLLSNLNLRTDLTALAGNVEVFTGNDKDYVATRVSYKLDLRGPSLNVNTACSTSLAAVSLACMHLVDFQCDMALAGGVSVQVPHVSGYLYQDLNGGLSRDGHCRPFDSQADGCVFGSGVAGVILKRLSDALDDGDHIHAVIRGWGVNNDGARKAGFMAPSVDGHAEVVAEAQAMAGFPPDTVSMIEAHGTGTRMGDPIETAALTMAFRSGTERRNYCSLGSVKGNVGHLVSAAGVTGLIKTALALEHKLIPPTVHFERPNERLLLDQSPFRVHNDALPWPRNGTPRRAGVSSLGVGGTNVHLCLEEAPERPRPEPRNRAELLIVSAQTTGALDESTANLAAHLRSHADLRLEDVAHTLRIGRREFQERRCLVASGIADAAAVLESPSSPRIFTASAGTPRPVVFLFSGAGAPAPGAIREIYDAEAVFRTAFDECATILKQHSRLLDVDFLADTSAGLLARATYGLPALFATQYALARLWASWGIAPETMLGYSSGEYVAACLSGVFSLPDALTLVAARGRLLDAVPAGIMLAVQMSEQAALQVLTPGLSIAGINAPSVCVVSGDREEIGRLESRLRSERVPSIRIPVGGAAHSSLVEPALPMYGEVVARTPLHPPRQSYLSTVTGDWIRDEEATDPAFWVRHMRETVRFSDALQRLLDKPRLFLEIGPGDSLATTARRHFHLDNGHASFASLRNSGGAFRAHEYLLATLGRLWTLGTDVNWTAFDPQRENRRVPLPTYPFQRQRYWVEPSSPAPQPSATPLEGVAGWLNIQSWKRGDSVEAAIAGTRWLVFANQDSLSAQVCARLESRGAEVVRVTSAGVGFVERSAREFSFPGDDRRAYAALFDALQQKSLLPDHIAHLWTLPASSAAGDDLDAMQGAFFRLLHLFASTRARSSEAGVKIGIIANQMADIEGSGRNLCPEKAMLLAPCLVCPREYPDLSCRAIDVGDLVPGSQAESVIAGRLIDEIAVPSSHLLVALRGSSRWLLNWEPHSPLTPAVPLESLRERGVYLLTGGLGNVGILLAEHLARKHARLILCGRSPFPARAEWEAWLASHEDRDPVSLKIAALLRMEQAGAVVEVHSLDCADRASMLALVHDATRRHGPLHGIFHLAGAIERKAFCLMDEATDEHFRINLRAKAQALPVLADAMAVGGAEFCILFSSLAAVFGGLGNSLYAAANQYMDAFARSRNGCGSGRWISLNWDLWKIPRQDGDSHVATLENLFAQGGVGMSPEQGFEVLSRVLASSREPHILVSTGDLRTRLEEFALTTQSRGKSGRRKSKRQVQNQYVAPRTEVEALVASIWQTVLGCESIGVHDNFFELGGESLLAVRCAQRIRDTLQVEVPLRSLLETPTVAAVAEAIEAVRSGRAEPPAAKTRLARLRVAPADAAARPISLVCVPYAGGNAIMYKPMADALPPHYAVYAADPPGSDYGSADAPMRPDQVAKECVDELLRTDTGSVEVYGHCGGIVTAMEIARMLEEKGLTVRALFAGGVMPFSDDARADRKNVESLRKLSDADLAHYLRKMGALDEISDPLALRFVVEGFRNDAQATFEYYQQYCTNPSGPRLHAPIFCIVGDKDPLTSDYRKRVRFWKRFSDSVHLAVLRGGGHYFVRHQPAETARLISHREAFKEQ